MCICLCAHEFDPTREFQIAFYSSYIHVCSSYYAKNKSKNGSLKAAAKNSLIRIVLPNNLLRL